MFVAGRFVVPPQGLPGAVGVKHPVDYAQNVREWEAAELGTEWESPGVSLADATKNPRCRIRGREVGNCAEAAEGRCRCEPLRPLGDHEGSSMLILSITRCLLFRRGG